MSFVAKVLTVGLFVCSPLAGFAQGVYQHGALAAPCEGLTRLPPVTSGPSELQPPGMASAHPGVSSEAQAVYAGLDGPKQVSARYGGSDDSGVATSYDEQLVSQPLLPDDPPSAWYGGRRFCNEWCALKTRVCSDYGNFYSRPTLRDLAIGFGLGAILANTALDQEVQDWYQDDVRNSDTDDVATFFKTFGEGKIFIPAFAGLALLNFYCRDVPLLGIAGEFGDRTTRAYLVGAPAMLLMQLVTGASRPGESGVDSQWKPFDDNNGVSGHAFMGGVPFITAAMACDNFALKSGLYLLSGFTAWSRVNDDRHYLSQACLGWWMAYLACRSVLQTNFEQQPVTILPIASREMTGVGLMLQY